MSNLPDNVKKIDDEIAHWKLQMSVAEMSNGRYYTDGSRQRDLDHLAKLENDRAEAVAAFTQL